MATSSIPVLILLTIIHSSHQQESSPGYKFGYPDNCLTNQPTDCHAIVTYLDTGIQMFQLTATGIEKLDYVALGFSPDGQKANNVVINCQSEPDIVGKLGSYDDKGNIELGEESESIVLNYNDLPDANGKWSCGFVIKEEINGKGKLLNGETYQLILSAGKLTTGKPVADGEYTDPTLVKMHIPVSATTSTTTTEKPDDDAPGAGSALHVTCITVFLSLFAYFL